MATNPMVQMARRGWLTPMLELGRLGGPYYRIAFRGAGLRSGILRELDKGPTTVEQLITALGFDPDLADGLKAWLDAGVTFGELSRHDGRYAVRRRSLKRLLRPANDPVAAFTEEMADLQHRLLTQTPDRLRTGTRFAVSDADPATIARSSVIGEPWITAALQRHVPRTGDARLMEVGCGSGAHIRTATTLNPHLTAVGVELQEGAADIARRNIGDWGLGRRVEIVCGDVRDLTPEGPVDLITLHQNIYYFTEDEQTPLLGRLREFLAPGGTLLITTIVRNSALSGATLDLWGAMSEGTSRLPVPAELVERMHRAGFADARAEKLGGEGLYRAFVGTRS